MPIDFFSSEVSKIQQRFNETYRGLVVYDVRGRMAAIMSIAWLGVLGQKLSDAQAKDRSQIQEFMRIKGIIEGYLNRVKEQRRCKDVERTDKEAIGKAAKTI